MNKKMLDILVCPIDKYSPLELITIKTKEIKNDEEENTIIVEDGILCCKKCSRFYPIMEEIPIMLPDELRDKELDIGFLKNNKDVLPHSITKNGKPWHL
jgi:uncharacterized protein YbaR (Trm112 family)